jgi:hypothetical protein
MRHHNAAPAQILFQAAGVTCYLAELLRLTGVQQPPLRFEPCMHPASGMLRINKNMLINAVFIACRGFFG